jgi:type II secretory pathway pseudopilin PulG
MTGTTLLIIIIVVAVILLALVAILIFSRRGQTRRREEQRERTREEFGEEYERTARERGSEEEAEKELRQRRGRVERQVVSISDESRRNYEERWEEVERVFVDNPERSIEMADRTVSDLLEERNFVADTAQDDQETEEGLAAMYPDIAGDYREARHARADIVARSVHDSDADEGPNEETTEDLRQVVRKYRLVYERLARD